MSLEKEKKELPCPKCKKPIKTTLYDICTRRVAKCISCGSMYKFDGGAAANMRTAITNFENAQKRFEDAYEKLMETADFTFKH